MKEVKLKPGTSESINIWMTGFFGHQQRNNVSRFRKFSEIGPRTRLAYQFSKVGIGSHTKTRLSGLSLRSSEGSGLSNPKEIRSVRSSDCFHQKVISLDSNKAHVTHRDISFLRKNSTSGKVTHETFSVVPKVTGIFLNHLKW